MRKMRKEVAIGLSMIALLLGVFGFLLYKRLVSARTGEARPPLTMAARLAAPIDDAPAKPTRTTLGEADDSNSQAVTPPVGNARDTQSPRLAQALAPAESPDGIRNADFPANQHELAPASAPDGTLVSNQEPAATRDWSAPGQAAAYQSPSDSTADPTTDYASTAAATSEAGLESTAAEPVDEPAGEQPEYANPLRDRRSQSGPTEAIATSGTLPAESAQPGFRSHIPHDEYAQPDYGAADQQPAHMPQAPAREFSRSSAPVAVENGKYTVQPNDNYWAVSQKVYGDGGYFKAIHEHNRLRFPRADKMQVGDVLDVPPAAVLHERYAELCPKQRRVPSPKHTLMPASTRHRAGERVYVVGEGDTLFDIARYELGKAARWAEIYDLNRDVLGEDFDYLRPGTELVLPHSPRETESVTRKNEPGFQR